MRAAGASSRRREAPITQHPADWSIPGDQQEKERIQLEQEVLNRIGTLDYTFENTDTHSRGTGAGTENNDDDDRDASVEYGRHRGAGDGAYSPGGDLSISSFARGGHGAFGYTDMSYTDHSYTQTQTGQHQQQHPRAQAPTLREDGDESVLRGGDTLSTAQHHASAVTLGAGLGGYPTGPSTSRTPSRANISAREFDPERKLTDLLSGRVGLSILDESTTFTQNRASKRSPGSKDPAFATSFGTGDPIIVEDTAELDRALESGRVAFEPAAHAERYQSDPGNETSSDPEGGMGDSESSSSFSFQPKSRAESHSPQMRASSAAGKLTDALPDVNVNLGPKRSRSAQDHYKTDYHSAAHADERDRRAAAALSRSNPQKQQQQRAPPSSYARPSSQQQQRAESGVVAARLPDMTGLTTAVETPAKASRRYLRAKRNTSNAAAIHATVDQLANKIRGLETENVTSRRRVRELEHELEQCRADVLRERTRVQIELQKHRDPAPGSFKDRKGKAKAVNPEQLIDFDDEVPATGTMPQDRRRLEARYQEVLEAKKDLEKTVAQLRAQLASMTAQLDEQKQAVEELQARRTEDEAQIMQRSNEVDELRAEVERLGIEVRRLRSLVEAKLRERRYASGRQPVTVPQRDETEDDIETQLEQSHAAPDTEHGEPADGWYAEDVEMNPNVQPAPDARRDSYERKQRGPLSTVSEVDEPQSNESGIPPERPPSRMRRPVDLVEGDSEVGAERVSHTRATMGSSGRPRRRFINIAELDRIESEVEERRSMRSYEASSASDETIQAEQPPTQQSGPSRTNPAKTVRPTLVATAFPQIRGSKLEHLFFSLPDHNETTCRTCRQGNGHPPPRGTAASSTRRVDPRNTEDGQRKMLDAAAATLSGAGRRGHADEDALPPQAVLARLLRELEDDFTHHKSMYLELAEQYGAMDPASNVLKRNVLADHLRDIIDILEKKGDQIAALYDALKLRKGVQEVVEGARLAHQQTVRGKTRARS